MNKLVMIFIALGLFIGCTTIDVRPGIYNEILFSENPNADYGTISIIRKNQFAGSAALIQVMVDEKIIGGFSVGQTFKTDIPTGKHLLFLRAWNGVITYLPINISKSEHKYYYFENGIAGVVFKEIDETIAKNYSHYAIIENK